MWYHEKILRKGVIWMELCKRDETQAEKVCFTGEQGLYIYDNGTAGRNAIGQICLLPEISAVLNQSDAVCIPLTAAASSILSISIYC